MDNVLAFPEGVSGESAEFFETLFRASGAVRVERIVSHGQTTPEGEWYDQEEDEWVAVLEGEARLRYEDGAEVLLRRGEHLFLPRHCRHRVVYTSCPCLWLAIHGTFTSEGTFAAKGARL